MKKIDFGKMLGTLANLGVLAGILLLAYELNQTRELTRAEIRNSLAESLTAMILNGANNSDLAEITLKAHAGETLTPIERYRFSQQENARMRLWENAHYQYRNGLFDESEWSAQLEAIRGFVNDHPEREMWCARQLRQSASFVAEINSLLEVPCE